MEPSDAPFDIPESWEWVKLKSFTYDLQYGTSKKSLSEGIIPVLRMGNIAWNGTVNYTDLVYSSKEDDIVKYSLQYNDLLFNRTNSSEWVGKTAIYKAEKNAIYAGYLIRIRTFGVSPDFINYVMNSLYHRSWCNQVKTDAVNQSNINAQKLSNFLIPLPPLAEQQRIVAEIEKWFAVIDEMEASRQDLQEAIKLAKGKILDLAIHGKLVPQDPKDEPATELLKRINPAAKSISPIRKSADSPPYRKDKNKVPFEIPESWEFCCVEELFNLNPKNNVDDNKTAGFIPMELVSAGFVNAHTFEKRKWGEVKKGHCHFQNGDIGIAKISPCFENRKSTIFYGLPNNIGAGTTELVILRGQQICAEFYLYLFKSAWYINEGTKYFKGVVGQQRVNKEIFTTFLIPLPPLAEQKRIVRKIAELFSYLDEISAEI